MRTKIGVICLVALVASGPVHGEEYIRIVAFNIADFGDTKEYDRSIISLVNIIRQSQADLLCLQEIEPSLLGKEQVKRLVFWLNKAATHDNTKHYSYAISDSLSCKTLFNCNPERNACQNTCVETSLFW